MYSLYLNKSQDNQNISKFLAYELKGVKLSNRLRKFYNCSRCHLGDIIKINIIEVKKKLKLV